MKTIVLTLELELFFGSDSGTVENSMIRPVRKLLELVAKHKMKFTVFWDVMHYIRICQLANDTPDLQLDKELIENEIKHLLKEGHDIQMHIHPHWLDSTWDGHKWVFDYTRYKIQDLSDSPNPDDINTILGCITIARKTVEKVCREVIHNYHVTSFRAGSNSTIPFEALGQALLENQILIDSSAVKGIERLVSFAPIDYTWMPEIQYYPFKNSPLVFDSNGQFWEFPIETIAIGPARRLYLNMVNRMKYVYTGRYGDGKGIGTEFRKPKRRLTDLLKVTYAKFTPEDSFPEEWNYFLKKARDMSICVIQPKNMSPLSFKLIEDGLESGSIRFISLKQRLDQLGINTPQHQELRWI
jgi:hypothetical protein